MGRKSLPASQPSKLQGILQDTWRSEFNPGSEGLLLISDAAHLPFLFVRNPDWTPAFDMDKELARQSRRKLLDQAAADRLPVAAYHWGFPNVGYVKQVGTGFDLLRMPFPA